MRLVRPSAGAPLRLVALAAAALAIAGCGGDDDGGGDLVWKSDPRLFTPPTLPNDRILTGEIRNDSLQRIDLTARDLKLRTDGGEAVDSAAIFGKTFGRGVFPQNRGEEIPEQEQLRIGLKAKLEPGDEVPLTVSWRERQGHPTRIDYGSGSLPIPDG